MQAGTGWLAEGGGFPAEGVLTFTQRVEGEVAELLGWLQQVQPVRFQHPRTTPGSLHRNVFDATRHLLVLCQGRKHVAKLKLFPGWLLPECQQTGREKPESSFRSVQSGRVSLSVLSFAGLMGDSEE